jgi:ribosomal-protein-alanine N-acetyltransferase
MTSPLEPTIGTSRLELHNIGVGELLSLYRDPGAASVYDGHGYSNPLRVLIDDSGPLRWRVPQVEADPGVNKWFVRFVVLRTTRSIVGHTSFHLPPNEDGMIEIGLTLHSSYRRQGLGTEVVRGMWSWGVAQPEVAVHRYTVSPTNHASVHLVQRFGFEHVGQQIDEEDGVEDIYEMAADEFRERHAVTWQMEALE